MPLPLEIRKIMSDTHIIVYTSKGRTLTLTGWRLWLFILAAYLMAAFMTVVFVLLFLGFAVSLGMIVLFAVPLAVVFAVISTSMRYLRTY